MVQILQHHPIPAILCATPAFEVKVADSLSEVEAALRLRFEVFNLEMQEGLQSSYESGFDSDVYDTYCDHLIVKERATGAVVGTYRLLTQQKAAKNIGFYSENEFDLSSFASLRGNLLEAGRSCVAKPFRSLAVINLLWSGIARYLELHSITHLFGCASFKSSDPRFMSAVHAYCSANFPPPAGLSVTPLPHCRMDLAAHPPVAEELTSIFRRFPPLVKGYLRLGAAVCGEPAYDAEFGTSDLMVMVATESITAIYKDHYLRQSVAA